MVPLPTVGAEVIFGEKANINSLLLLVCAYPETIVVVEGDPIDELLDAVSKGFVPLAAPEYSWMDISIHATLALASVQVTVVKSPLTLLEYQMPQESPVPLGAPVVTVPPTKV